MDASVISAAHWIRFKNDKNKLFIYKFLMFFFLFDFDSFIESVKYIPYKCKY